MDDHTRQPHIPHIPCLDHGMGLSKNAGCSMALRPEKSMFSNIKTRYISPLFGPYMCLKSLEMSFSLSPEPQGLWKPRRNPFKTPRRAADVAKAQASNPISWQSWGSQVVGFQSRIEVTNPSIPS